MADTTTLPPSPALSFCDSLNDEDLDALLASLGELSRFVTPRLKKKDAVTVQVKEVSGEESEDDEDADEFDYTRIALHFARETSSTTPTTHFHHATLIQTLLPRARLPAQLLALSYNLLRRYSLLRPLHPSSLAAVSADILTVAALALAVSYTDDHPPKSTWWSRQVCHGVYSAAEIDGAMLDVLVTVDWALLHLAAEKAVERAMEILFPAPSPLPPAAEVVVVVREKQEVAVLPQAKVAPVPLKIAIGSTTTSWVEGQLTPADTPLSSPLDVPRAYFLPLL
ncbi:hypothetical protein B0A55_04990 [Friedmanniomyces simplex]|uniref:Uncharacterized protein n=1 Tax=Friedmanniomyces simplex TaxID=329884 RepID=A0A4U0X6K4_9PEZI|nr:hypothetical protein B0A55_04990 [Friedmanniomyces simplex]